MFKVELNSGKKTYSYTVDRLGKGDTVEIEPDNGLLVFEKDLAAFNRASKEFQELKQVNQPFVQGKIPAPTISNLEKYTIARYVDESVPEKVEDEGYKLTFDGHPDAIFYLKVSKFDDMPVGWTIENVNTGFRASNIKDTAEQAYKDFMTKLTGAFENVKMSDEKNVKLINDAGFNIEKLKATTEPVEQKKIPKKPFERTFVPPTRDAEGNVISREGTVENSISNWMKQNPVNPLTDSIQTLADRYNKEKLSTETIEEFLKRLSCK
jgi:hypothetical protein